MDHSVLPEIIQNTLKKTVEADGIILLEIELSFPKLSGTSRSCERINRFYDEAAERRLKYAMSTLTRRAARARGDCLASGLEFTPHRLETKYEIVRHSSNILALFWDSVESSTGEEPVAVRHVDNWDLRSGTPLSPVFARKRRKALLRDLGDQASSRAKAGESFYNDVRRNAKRYFKSCNCALGENGLVIYYPMYSLASFGAGFPKFEAVGDFSYE